MRLGCITPPHLVQVPLWGCQVACTSPAHLGTLNPKPSTLSANSAFGALARLAVLLQRVLWLLLLVWLHVCQPCGFVTSPPYLGVLTR